jgi:hypothetical protein
MHRRGAQLGGQPGRGLAGLAAFFGKRAKTSVSITGGGANIPWSSLDKCRRHTAK